MTSSLSRRIFRTFFINSLVSLVVVVAFVWLIFDDMEDALIERDAIEQLAILERDSRLTGEDHWQSESMTALFVDGEQSPEKQEELFAGIRAPFAGERERGGRSYYIIAEEFGSGVFYVAKDVTEFEAREELFTIMLGVLCLIVLALNFMLSGIANRRVIGPLQKLTYQIRRAGSSENHLSAVDENFADVELVEIAEAFNRFTTEIRALIDRERTLISLASHELRTPTAIISGALQVIEQRDQLGTADKITFARIRNAVEEMEDNIETLLTLSRRARSSVKKVSLQMDKFLNVIVDEFAFINTSDQARIQRHWQVRELQVNTDPVLAKLLIRNLLRNALNHTNGTISLVLTDTYLDVLDQGAGLPDEVAAWLQSQTSDLPKQEGLGLYIVTLALEQLGWAISQTKHPEFGGGLRVFFSGAATNNLTPVVRLGR
ncbi:ATP-binding protein [Spongiibacter marinus]|uniref:sensor histidine kinase n=1 Tax=Spongiibacter marinus TaxID=354246 RepID=UPI003C456A8A